MTTPSSPKRGDFLLIGGILFVAVILILTLTVFSRDGRTVEVTVDGIVVTTLPLNTDTQLVINGIGGQNTVVIADGKAYVSNATCPDKVCQRHRAISRSGEQILCLPHKVTVTVVGGQPAVDAEVGS